MMVPFFRQRSLRVKLLATTLGALSGYIVIIGILAYLSAKDSIGDAYDDSLIVNANALMFLMKQDAEAGGLDKTITFKISVDNLTEEEKTIFKTMAEYKMFRIWHRGKLIITSADDWPEKIPAFAQGFVNTENNDEDWRIYSLHEDSKQLIVELGEELDIRHYVVASIAGDLILPFLLSLPLVAFMFWRAIHTGMADLQKVTSQVNTRSPEKMTPLETSGVPQDILPLMHAINGLLHRLDLSLSRERQITELAAHELRTPLTAIKLQAQMGLKAPDDEARIKALKGLLEGVERGGHLVEQLLTLTRVEQSEFQLSTIDAADVLARVCYELKPLSEKREQSLDLDTEPPLIVQGSEDLLHLMFTNLVGNAIKYSPDKSSISITSTRLDDAIVIEIKDQGPGIPEGLRDKIFERFFRYHSGKILGSGLGLTIARQCAEHMQAELSFRTPQSGSGACARIRFPKRG